LKKYFEIAEEVAREMLSQPLSAANAQVSEDTAYTSYNSATPETADVKPLATLDPDLTLKSQVRMVALQLAKGDPEYCRRLAQRLDERGETGLEAVLFPMGTIQVAGGGRRRGGGSVDGERGAGRARTKRRRGSVDSEEDTIDPRPRPTARGTKSRRGIEQSDFVYYSDDRGGPGQHIPMSTSTRRGRASAQGLVNNVYYDMGPPARRGHGGRAMVVSEPLDGSPNGFDLFEEDRLDKSASDFEDMIGQLPSPRAGDAHRWSNGSAGDDYNVFGFTVGGSAIKGVPMGGTEVKPPLPSALGRTFTVPKKRAKLEAAAAAVAAATGAASSSSSSVNQGLPPRPRRGQATMAAADVTSAAAEDKDNSTSGSDISAMSDAPPTLELGLGLVAHSPVIFGDVGQDLADVSFGSAGGAERLNDSDNSLAFMLNDSGV
jgi:hypothetical protein